MPLVHLSLLLSLSLIVASQPNPVWMLMTYIQYLSYDRKALLVAVVWALGRLLGGVGGRGGDGGRGACSTMAFSLINYKWLPFVAGGGRNLLRIG